MSVKVSLLRKTAIAAGLVGATTGAQAIGGLLGYVDSTFLGDVGGHFAWMGLNIDGTGSIFDSTDVFGLGFFKWQQTYAGNVGDYDARGNGYAPKALDQFYTICGQFVSIDPSQDFRAYDSSDGTDPQLDGVERGGAVAAAGWAEAIGGNELEAAAFQVAVWTAVYGNGTAWNVVGTEIQIGSWKADSGDSNWNFVRGRAQYYYEKAYSGFQQKSIYLDSIFNGSQTGQDQYTVAVPEPFTMTFGLAGIAAYIRRRAKNAKRA